MLRAFAPKRNREHISKGTMDHGTEMAFSPAARADRAIRIHASMTLPKCVTKEF